MSRRLKILDFDIECRPIAFYGGDWVTKQPTAIGWKFIGSRAKPDVAVIGESDRSSLVLDEEITMLELFREAYDEADVVTGHYIRGFDLGVLAGAMLRLELAPLGQKMTQDTKLDLQKASGLSKSMENLSAMFDAKTKKYQMDTAKWGAANMLLPEGIAFAKRRVTQDVREHIELRSKLLELDALGPGKVWRPGATGSGKYAP